MEVPDDRDAADTASEAAHEMGFGAVRVNDVHSEPPRQPGYPEHDRKSARRGRH
jgi:hypothetical protein